MSLLTHITIFVVSYLVVLALSVVAWGKLKKVEKNLKK
jgi:hypothetical protein